MLDAGALLIEMIRQGAAGQNTKAEIKGSYLFDIHMRGHRSDRLIFRAWVLLALKLDLMYLADGDKGLAPACKNRGFMAFKILLIAIAGSAGTLARYGLAGLVQRIGGVSFPWGTFAVNIIGCFAAGFIWTMFENRWSVSGEIRAIVLIGFFGAFTTFSAFILETGELIRSAEWLYAFGNILMQNGIGLAALFAGIALARAV